MYRYPGIQPFTTEHRHLFFGRAEDIDALYRMIDVEQVIFLHGKSGMGKTSLLQAGILPKLQEQGQCKEIPIRFSHYVEGGQSPLQIMQHILHRQTALRGDLLPENTLWSLLKLLQLAFPGEQFILIFDQFEELFSYPEAQIQAFKEEMAELLYVQTPQRWRDFLQESQIVGQVKQVLLNEPIPLKAVFTARSDKMGLLSRLTDKLPDLLSKTYELRPLTRKQAQQAVVKPARQPGDFHSPPFVYQSAALESILTALTDQQGHGIESFQLQIVCQAMERKAIKHATKSEDDDLLSISIDDLGNLADIFNNFYKDQISSLPDQEEAVAQRFIEDRLIDAVSESRISLDQKLITELNQEQLERLVDTRLLRMQENSTGGFSYELSHDTLVKPILKERRLREEAEERLREEQKAQEILRAAQARAEKEKAEREQARAYADKLQRQYRTAMMAVGIAVILLFVSGYFIYKADTNLKIAQQALQDVEEAEAARNRLQIEDLRGQISLAARANEQEFLCQIWAKIRNIDSAYPIDSLQQEAQQKVKACGN